jgi:hypothetical protein
MIKRNLHLPAIMLGIGLLHIPTTQSHAAEWPDRVSLAGFMSSVYSKTDQEYPFNGELDEAGIDNKGSFQGTRVGLNVNARITDRVSLASQLYASREEEGFNSHIDWSFISYAVNDNLTVRAGKIKYPVGLVNEYVDVGVAYPWIAPPQLYYGEEMNGSLATREAYTGASLLLENTTDDWTLTADFFAGEVAGEKVTLREMIGLTVAANWDDTVVLQASTVSAGMYPSEAVITAMPMMVIMEDETLTTTSFGIKIDWNNIIAYTEAATIDMGDFEAGNAEVMYTTLGYRIGDWLPFVSYQTYEKNPDEFMMTETHEQTITTFGVKYDLARNTALKLEYSTIETDSGEGLFEPDGAEVEDATMMSIALDVVF